MTMPFMQKPHCAACSSMNAVCSRCGCATLPNPSRVVMLLFCAALVGMVQDRTDFPSRITVHAPHWPRPQPNFGPCSPRLSRKTYKSGVLESALTTRAFPFTLSEICAMANLLSRRTCGKISGIEVYHSDVNIHPSECVWEGCAEFYALIRAHRGHPLDKELGQ